MPFFIAGDCLDVLDKSCIEECPVDCIYEGGRKMYIHPRECIDCGACEVVCPVTAIVSDLTMTDDNRPWKDDNAAFFSEVLSRSRRAARLARWRGKDRPDRRRHPARFADGGELTRRPARRIAKHRLTLRSKP